MFLFGDSLKSCCVAIIVPDEEVLMNWASSYGRKGVPFEELCKDEAVHHVILEDLKETAKNGGLNSLETVCLHVYIRSYCYYCCYYYYYYYY